MYSDPLLTVWHRVAVEQNRAARRWRSACYALMFVSAMLGVGYVWPM